MSDRDYDSYRQVIEEVNRRTLSNSEAFDKAILSLSSAGLGLSLTFFKLVIPVKDAVSISLLKCGWFLFLGAIVSTLVSFVVSQRALRIEIIYAEKYYLENLNEYAHKTSLAAKATEALNIISGFLFICALISIVSFVTNNI